MLCAIFWTVQVDHLDSDCRHPLKQASGGKPPITGPHTAVRAEIAAEQRAK